MVNFVLLLFFVPCITGARSYIFRRDDPFFAAQSESRISAPFFASKTVVFVLTIILMQISMLFAD